MKKKLRKQLVLVGDIHPPAKLVLKARRTKKAKLVELPVEDMAATDEREKLDRKIDLDSMLEFMAARHREMFRVMRLRSHGYTNAEIAKIEQVEERHVYRLQADARAFLATHFPGMFPV